MGVEFSHRVDPQTTQPNSSPSPNLHQPTTIRNIFKGRKSFLEYSSPHLDGLPVLLLPGRKFKIYKILSNLTLQGNSNSLANVDVAPAFIGSETYNPVYATILTLAHSYASPIHATILSPMSYQPILLSRLLPMVFFCILVVFQRHHLFVWSVFSPKLLIDSALTLVLFSVLCFHALLKFCRQ